MNSVKLIQDNQVAEIRFLVKSATKMAPVTPRFPLVGDIKYQKVVSKVSENLSQHQKLVSSSNEGIEDHLGRPNGQKT